MQQSKVFALDIPAGLFDLGAQIHGAGQGLVQKRNHVQADFRGHIDPRGTEDGGMVAVVHILSFRLSASSCPHVRALVERFAPYATVLRADIMHAAEVEDAGSAAIYTDISRGVDKRLWFLEAYLHRDGVNPELARQDGRRAE